MSDIKELTKKVIIFSGKRDWRKFHNPKDLAISLSLESSEVLEHFQWKNPDEIEKYVKSKKENISDELADVFKYLLMLSHDLKIDLSKAVINKMKKDNLKYPISKSKGTHLKYTELK